MKTYMRPHNIFVFTLIFSIISCSKEDDPGLPAANCQIMTTSITSGTNTTVYNLSYNTEGEINIMTSNDLHKTRYHFSYAAGEFVREEFSDDWDGQLTSHLHAELNSMGLPVRIILKRYGYASAGSAPPLISTGAYTYEYNSKGELQFASFKRDVNKPDNSVTTFEDTYTYSWADGNVAKIVGSDGSITNFEYYTDKPTQKGDYLEFYNVLGLGISEYKNKNLMKSMMIGTTVINVNYEYDEEARIKTVRITGTGVPNGQELNYQYSCN